MFLDLPLKELFDQTVPLRHLIKDTVNKLEDDLSGTDSHQKRRLIAEEFLISRIRENESKYNYERIRHSINQINQTGGVLDIDSMASDAFLSRKQFERIFSDIIGATPKQFFADCEPFSDYFE